MARSGALRFWLLSLLALVFLGACAALWWRREPWVATHTFKDLMGASLSSTGEHVIGIGADPNTAEIVDLRHGQPRILLQGHTEEISFARFSADGRSVLTAGSDGTLRIWDAQSGRPLQVLRLGEDDDASAELSPDGGFVVTGSNYGCVKLWRTRDGAKVRSFGSKAEANEVARFSPDGKRIATVGTHFSIWDAESGAELLRFPRPGNGGHYYGVDFSEDGEQVITHNILNEACVFDSRTGRLLQQLKCPNPIAQNFFVRGTALALVVSSASLCKGDGAVRVWDLSSGRVIRMAEGTYGKWSAARSANGGRVLLCSGGMDASFSQPKSSLSTIWLRRRPEAWWGVAWLPELWIALFSGAVLLVFLVSPPPRPLPPVALAAA
jgi:WD40 repeat protein